MAVFLTDCYTEYRLLVWQSQRALFVQNSAFTVHLNKFFTDKASTKIVN